MRLELCEAAHHMCEPGWHLSADVASSKSTGKTLVATAEEATSGRSALLAKHRQASEMTLYLRLGGELAGEAAGHCSEVSQKLA